MAVTLTIGQFVSDARIGQTAEELDIATRRFNYAVEAVRQHLGAAFATTPDTVVNEAVSRLASYLYDQPTISGGAAFSNAMRNSGAGRMLLPYRVHGAGIDNAIGMAQEAVGIAGNPVTGLAVERGQLVVTFSDGTTTELALPSGRDVGQTDIFDARLPGAAVAMRFGWTLDSVVADESTFIRNNNHPDDGAAEGTTAGLLTPMIPGHMDAEGYRFHVWIAGDVGLVSLLGPYGDNWLPEFPLFGDLTVDGVDGILYSERHSRSNEDGLYSFVGLIPGELIATQPWVEAQLGGITPGGMFGGVDQTARDSAEAAQTTADSGVGLATAAQLAADAAAAVATQNTTAIGNLVIPDVYDWALTGNTSRFPISKIPLSVQGHRVYVQTSTPAVGQLGDIWIQDLTTAHPRIYEHNGTAVPA